LKKKVLLKNSIFLCLSLFFLNTLHAQKKTSRKDTTIFLNKTDTVRVIEIIHANSMRFMTINDSTQLQTLAGKAKIKESRTLLEGDSIVINKRLGTIEVFGSVHINDADTLNVYANYLRYNGKEKTAFLKGNVKLFNGKTQLYTNILDYNVSTGIANYKNGGKVINGKTILTSKEATYYSDTKDIFFKKDVKLKDPKYEMEADSLRYNTFFKTVYFIAPTIIKTEGGTIKTNSGMYDLRSGEAVFYENTSFTDNKKSISGDRISFDDKNNTIQIEGNGKVFDLENQVIVLGDQILINKATGSFLATRKPIMIFYKNNDSTYISADTLYSAKRIRTFQEDTIKQNGKANSMDSIRFFIGFRHVKMFNDSVQAVCDSFHYSSSDSTFKLYQNPICWNGSTQLNGDTILLSTQNQKPKLLSVINHSMLINQTKEGLFNQMSGYTLYAFFDKGLIDHAQTNGLPAQSIFYPQDDKENYLGMSSNFGNTIEAFFVNKVIHTIKYTQQVNGTLFPINQIPEDQKYIKDFKWNDDIRPKNKFQIFE
jgi:lipopolysaccharide export system protein LptA